MDRRVLFALIFIFLVIGFSSCVCIHYTLQFQSQKNLLLPVFEGLWHSQLFQSRGPRLVILRHLWDTWKREELLAADHLCYRKLRRHLFLAPSSLREGGIGVFSSKTFSKGDLVEVAPMVLIDKEKASNNLIRYSFYLKKPHPHIGLGYTALYNHSSKSNVVCKPRGRFALISATRTILPFEELSMNYGEAFEKKHVKKEVDIT